MPLTYDQLPENLGDLLTNAGGFVERQPPTPIPQNTTGGIVPPTQAPTGPSVGGRLKDAWKGYIQRIQSDPNLRQAIFQTGVGLMRTPEFGKGNADVAADALSRGMMTLQMLREQEERKKKEARGEQREDRKIVLDEQRTGAQVEASRASTKAAETQTKLAEQELTPEYLAYKKELQQLGLDDKKADIAARRAQARASDAEAALRNRTDPNIRAEGGSGRDTDLQFTVAVLEQEIKRNNPNMPPEQVRAQAAAQAYKMRERASGGDTAARMFQVLLQSNPDVTANPQKQMELWTRAQEMAGQANQQAQAAVADQNAQQYVGKTVTVTKNRKQQQATVMSVTNGQAILRLPDGSTVAVPSTTVGAELGGQ